MSEAKHKCVVCKKQSRRTVCRACKKKGEKRYEKLLASGHEFIGPYPQTWRP